MMKIDNSSNVGGLHRATQQVPVEKVRSDRAGESGRAGGDSSHVSELAKMIARARSVAEGLPDVRVDRVEQARERVASGYYDRDEVRDAVAGHLADKVKESSG